MAATLFDFYLKYRNKVARTLENDPYYQYLFELIEGSDNTIQQTNRILHKEVDEKWLTKVEEGITAIDAIINKPRRFIKSEENVVPIELARKITAESVKHLSKNTQFISNMDPAGNIMPSKILNVTTQESYDLYENRFIFHLIKKLVVFIDKRTDVIFWSTGDETESLLKINSELEDDYEEIEYKLELRVKNRQSYIETDAQHMEVFKRIDRVRRIVMEFNRSPFMQVMEGCARVHSPIQRTNLIMKDPNYKKCYTLWSFLEQYDDVGYSIDVKETALDFDEEYLYQVYSNIILNYTVFKTLLDDDRRPIDQNVKKRKKIKPKFVKQIVEEIVDDYDIPDVEIRKVIIEEITKAQAEIERRQAEAEKKRLAVEKQKEKERLAKEKEKARLKALAEKEKEKERKAKEKEREKARLAKEKEKARLKAIAEKEKEKERKAKEKEREKARLKAIADKEKEKERKAREKEREKARLAAEKEKEKEKLAREKEREKARLEKEKEKARLKALADQKKAKEKAATARLKVPAQAEAAAEAPETPSMEELPQDPGQAAPESRLPAAEGEAEAPGTDAPAPRYKPEAPVPKGGWPKGRDGWGGRGRKG